MRRHLIFSWILICVAVVSFAQPFAAEVKAFKQKDSLSFPAPRQVLFIGSSSFTLWHNVQDYFPGVPILNRAFGGSTLADVYYYRQQVIAPYQPRQVVIYCGENDFAASDTVSVSTVVDRFVQLFMYIRSVYPKMPVAYVSMKPSPSRRRLQPKFEAANTAIKLWLRQQKRTAFVDVYSAMLQPNGEPFPHIFLKDSLHMNAEGYAIWQQYLKPVLRKK